MGIAKQLPQTYATSRDLQEIRDEIQELRDMIGELNESTATSPDVPESVCDSGGEDSTGRPEEVVEDKPSGVPDRPSGKNRQPRNMSKRR